MASICATVAPVARVTPVSAVKTTRNASAARRALAPNRVNLRASKAAALAPKRMQVRAQAMDDLNRLQLPTPEEANAFWQKGGTTTTTAGAPPQQRGADIMSDAMGLLLSQRIIFLGSQVDDFTADAVVSQILLLDAQDSTKDIRLFVNSPGGSVTAGMGIYDAMQMARCDVSTVCFGLAASMGALILAGGAKGKRYSMPNARIMIHQPLGGASGQAVDIEIQAREIMYHKANLNRILAYHCNQPVTKVDEDTDRDRYMSPVEAMKYGIIDDVIGGEAATMVVEGDVTDYYKTKQSYISWGDDPTDDGSRASRFTKSRISKFDVDKVNEEITPKTE